jgi:hypothetical protein
VLLLVLCHQLCAPEAACVSNVHHSISVKSCATAAAAPAACMAGWPRGPHALCRDACLIQAVPVAAAPAAPFDVGAFIQHGVRTGVLGAVLQGALARDAGARRVGASAAAGTGTGRLNRQV